MADNQLQLFSEEETRPERPRSRKAGASTSIVFHDYESFLAKFTDRPKTTDDCFTPRDVYEAVVEYVGTVVDLSDKVILRPFFPGGDYENSDYPENGIVIDNPPFSLFIKIVAFYVMHRIPFFLFAPGMTVLNACRYCTAVLVDNQITWDNGAVVRVNFVSNLFGDTVAMTAPLLNRLLGACPSQNKPRLPSFSYPPNVMRVSDFNIICGGGV